MKMKKQLSLILLVICCLQASIQAQISFGKPEKLNDQWQFYLGDAKNAEMPGFDTSQWRILDLPHDWSVEGTLSPDKASCTGFLPGGIGWYRKSLSIPADKKNEMIYLYFEGVYNNSEVFVNGKSVGKRPNGYISFAYDITPYINYGVDNTIVVRVDHSESADSRWYTGSGIYRNVWLVYANPVHIAQWGAFYHVKKLTKGEALLGVEIEVENNTTSEETITILSQLFDAEKQTILAKSSTKTTVKQAGKASVNQTLKLRNPKLWSLESPYLYQLKTTVIKNGKTIDESVHPVGIRTLTFDPDKGFALNGQWMKVKGVCLHHDAGCLGSAVPREVWERRLNTLKNLGCNAIRMSHNPQAPDVYELCDEIGLLVMDEAFDEWEFPKRKWLEGWNVGTPGFQGAYKFFEEWSNRDIQDMVRRDRNHPSIMMWSIGNEVDYPNDPYSHPSLDGSTISQPMHGGYLPNQPNAERLGGIAKSLVAKVKQYDNSRPVTAALAGVVMSNHTEYPGALDIAGYNYTEDRYETDHKQYPSRVIYGSENRHDMEAWKIVRDNEYIFGQFLWTGIDYLGESGPWPSRGFYSGLLDFGGFQKPRGYFRQALWDEKPFVYIGTYPAPKNPKNLSMDAWPIWNYEEGKMIRVVCYTNSPQAQLLLNGTIVGQTKQYDDNTGIIHWDIPFQAGKLEVVGLDANNRAIASYVIQSSKQPYALKVTVDKQALKAGKELAHVIVTVVDEDGVPVMLADNEITCHISGQGKLLGLEAGNNSDMGDYRDNVQRCFHGRLQAYVQSTENTGNIELSFTSPWLKTVKIQLEVI